MKPAKCGKSYRNFMRFTALTPLIAAGYIDRSIRARSMRLIRARVTLAG